MKSIRMVLYLAILIALFSGCAKSSLYSESATNSSSELPELAFGFSQFSETQSYNLYTGNSESECSRYETQEEYLNDAIKQYRESPFDNHHPDAPTNRDLWCPAVDNEISVDEAYGAQVVSNMKVWTNHGSAAYSHPIHAYELFEPRPTFIREVNEAHRYMVYNAEGGGRFFVFYRGTPFPLDPTKMIFNNTLCIYVTAALSYDHFSSIQEGSDISQVYAIDRNVEWVQKNGIMLNRLYSYHLLTDGLLVIKYIQSGDSILVSKMLFSKDFTSDIRDIFDMPQSDETDFETMFGLVRQCKILPQDYPST